jgi:hypothetical protein
MVKLIHYARHSDAFISMLRARRLSAALEPLEVNVMMTQIVIKGDEKC